MAPPTIECPDNIETYSDNGTSYATVEWIEPEAQGKMNLILNVH